MIETATPKKNKPCTARRHALCAENVQSVPRRGRYFNIMKNLNLGKMVITEKYI